MKTLSIIIPCYNEKNTLSELVKRVAKVTIPGWKKEIIVVDDASREDTLHIVRALEKTGTIRALYLPKNVGEGGAVKKGIEVATGDYILIQDADLEYNPAEIPSLIKKIEKGDAKSMVYGSRNLHHEKRSGFIIPRLGVWTITVMVNTLYGQKLTDIWTCYKLFPRSAAAYFQAGRFESEIIFTLIAIRHGYSIVEAPISHKPRDKKEGKKIRYRDGFKAIQVIWADRLLHLKKSAAIASLTKDIAAFEHLLRSPKEFHALKREGNMLHAANGTSYRIDKEGRPHLIDSVVFEENTDEHVSGINWLKSFLKQFPKLYYAVWHLVCPVLMLKNGPRKITRFVKKAGVQKPIMLDVGSGPERLGKEFINLDVFPFPEVDIVSDATALPFATGSVDAVVSESVFEHVPRADMFAREMVRVLKPGGHFYVSAPFIHPYHASPDDFNRWTKSGLAYLFTSQDDAIEIVETGVRSGPWSAFLMFMAYWLGNVLSLGYAPAAPLISHVIMLPFGLLKYLDFIFMAIPGSDAVAAHLYVIGRKRDK